MGKICTLCRKEKTLLEFSPRKNGRLGLDSRCKECKAELARDYSLKNKEKISQNNAEWRKNNPGRYTKRSRGYVMKRYGITTEEYDELFLIQEGRCKICSRVSEKALHVDHDHKTGRVRGLLCHRCNTSIGLMEESADNLKRMIEYIGGYSESKD